MKLLVCHPGHSYSTNDVFDGLVSGLRALGEDVRPYNLHIRIGRAVSWLKHNYYRARRLDPTIDRPTLADALYQASVSLVEMALRELPDWVIVVTGSALHPDALIMLRRAGAPLAILFTESPYEDDAQAHLLSRRMLEPSRAPVVVFTSERTSVEALRWTGAPVHYLPHAYDPARHYAAVSDPETPAHDVVFVGTAFPERVDLLAAVDWTGIDLGLYGEWAKALPSRHRLRRYIQAGAINNRVTADLYRCAKIGLNLYRQSVTTDRRSPRIAGAESLNPRAYELAACGAFHLSEHRAELPDVFGETVPTFNSPAELAGLLRFYLDRPVTRAALAAAARDRIVNETWTQRARALLERLPISAQVSRSA